MSALRERHFDLKLTYISHAKITRPTFSTCFCKKLKETNSMKSVLLSVPLHDNSIRLIFLS